MTVTLHLGDCLEILPTLESGSVDLILTDPPYYKVKGEWWDRQWDTPAGFLAWLDKVLAEYYRILKPNGSLYLFASPKMAARVEVLIGERFNVLNRIRWIKEAGWHHKNKKEELRSYLSPWEEIIFAEHYGADNMAKGEAGYQAKCDELRGFVFEPIRDYLASEWERSSLTRDEVNRAINSSPNGGGGMASHYFSRVTTQWALPTEEHYKKLQEYFNTHANHGGEYLRREYEYLRREYEDLRREYEDLRRPFFATPDRPYTDVWDFPTVNHYPGKHPCEKPPALLEHIIATSTRPGAVVLDSFMGTGNTGRACKKLGRDFIGIEIDPNYYAIAEKRIREAQAQMVMELKL